MGDYMNNKNKISEAELEIMKIVWERQEAVASSDIVGILKKRCGWEDTTIYTMLSKLVKRGLFCGRRRLFLIILRLFLREGIRWSRRSVLLTDCFRGFAAAGVYVGGK